MNPFLLVVFLLMLVLLTTFIFFLLRRRKRSYIWPVILKTKSLTVKGLIFMAQLHTDEVLDFQLGKPVDSQGQEAEIEGGKPTITSSDENVFTIEPNPDTPDDTFTGTIVSQKPGKALLVAEGDADLGEGVQPIRLEIEIEVLEAGAVGFAPFTFGTPRKKTPPTT